jgi:hypothetical protein
LQENQAKEVEQLTSQLNLMAEDLNKQKKENRELLKFKAEAEQLKS